MQPKFRVAGRIARPVAEVFEAVADPAKLSAYFTTGGAEGRMQTGATVWWDFHDHPGRFPVEVVEVTAPERIVFRWEGTPEAEGAPPYWTTVTITFTALEDGRTLVAIEEEGWKPTEGGFSAAFGNCGGWMQMLCCLKAWAEHGINLREGMFA